NATPLGIGSMLAIIGLEAAEVRELCKRVSDYGIIEIAPFHSSLMELAKDNLARYLEKVEIYDPRIPIICNVTADYVRNKEEVRSALIEQMNHPVLWVDSIMKINSQGINCFIEVGPSKVLRGLIKQIIPEAEVFNVFDSDSLKDVVEKMREVL
ncbi:malonyl CoA-acyl carrier protein transacylase, partial [Candidatus Atribacteria bacterium 4572_76]